MRHNLVLIKEKYIGDSVVIVEAFEYLPSNTPTGITYVEDVDATYKQAMERGATSIDVPTDKPYSERTAGVKDSFGNIWYISTYKT